MARTLQVSCVQMHWATGIQRNLERTLDAMERAAREGSRVVLLPEANLTSYYFPYLVELDPAAVEAALAKTCAAARGLGVWAIAGTIRKTHDRFLNLAHGSRPPARSCMSTPRSTWRAATRNATAAAAINCRCSRSTAYSVRW